MKPERWTRGELLDRVMNNYRRFYMNKASSQYPWERTASRKYLMGCLKAFAKTTWTKKFYDLERLKFNGVNAQWDLGFDESKVLNDEQIAQAKRDRPDLAADVSFVARKRVHVPIKVMACGSGDHAAHDDDADYLDHVDHENNVDHEAALARQ